MLELESVDKRFKTQVFKDFSYVFKNNKIYFLSGPNGSGKSTLLKLVKGIYMCDKGKIKLDHNLDQKNDVIYVDGNFRTFFHRLTVRQNLEYFFSLQGESNNRNSLNNLLNYFNVLNLQDKIFSSLSQGQMQIISLIRGLSPKPKVILLDEVFSSLDKNNKERAFNYLSNFTQKEKKSLVIFTSHENSHKIMKFDEICLS